jgi:hypothetical protein
MSDRAGLFEDGDADFDVAGFGPKTSEKAEPVSPDAIRAVAEKANFSSRDPTAAKKEKKSEAPPRQARIHRTGRNVQVSVKMRTETRDAFYKLADDEQCVLGEVLDRAIAARNRELSRGSAKK